MYQCIRCNNKYGVMTNYYGLCPSCNEKISNLKCRKCKHSYEADNKGLICTKYGRVTKLTDEQIQSCK